MATIFLYRYKKHNNMGRYYYITFSCQICGRKTSTDTTRSRSKVYSQVQKCQICQRAMCGHCNHFGVCIDHYNFIPRAERDEMEEYQKMVSRKSSLMGWLIFALFVLGIAQLILNLNAQSEYAWSHYPGSIGFFEVRPESLPILIVCAVLITILFIVEGRLTNERNQKVQFWIKSHISQGTFSGRKQLVATENASVNTFTFNRAAFNIGGLNNTGINPTTTIPSSNAVTMKSPLKPEETPKTDADNGWN